MSEKLNQLLNAHYSVRAFRSEKVKAETIQEVFNAAQRSPSNCNTQPWQTYVVSGETKDQLKADQVSLIMSGAKPNPEFNWHVAYQGVHRDRQFGSANALYGAMGIARVSSCISTASRWPVGTTSVSILVP